MESLNNVTVCAVQRVERKKVFENKREIIGNKCLDYIENIAFMSDYLIILSFSYSVKCLFSKEKFVRLCAAHNFTS